MLPTKQPAPAPATATVAVEVSNTQAHLPVDPSWVARLVRRTLALEGVAAASISVAVVDDASIRVINCRHLGHDWATDVISFGLADGGAAELVGELVVSAEMATTVATDLGTPPLRELALYLVHGLLHLCGYDDHAEADVVRIRAREAAILDSLGWDEAGPDRDPMPTGSDHSGRESVRWPR